MNNFCSANSNFSEYVERTSLISLEENVQQLMTNSDDDLDPLTVFDRLNYESQRVLVEPVVLQLASNVTELPDTSTDIFSTTLLDSLTIINSETKTHLRESAADDDNDDDMSAVASRILLEGIAEENDAYETHPETRAFPESVTLESRWVPSATVAELFDDRNRQTDSQTLPECFTIKKVYQPTSSNRTKETKPCPLRRSQRRLERDKRLSTENIFCKNVEEEAKYLKARQNAIGEYNVYGKSSRNAKTTAIESTHHYDRVDDDEDVPLARCIKFRRESSPSVEEVHPLSSITAPALLPNYDCATSDQSRVMGKILDEPISDDDEHSSEEVSGEPTYCFSCAKIGMSNRMATCHTCRNTFHLACERLKSTDNSKEWTCRRCIERGLESLPKRMKKKLSNVPSNKITKRRSRKTSKIENEPKSSMVDEPIVCIVCRKNSTESAQSIFCGDTCIEKLAVRVARFFKDETHRVPVIEKRDSGKKFSGSSAPLVKNLADWLKRNRKFYPQLPSDLATSDTLSLRRDSDSVGPSSLTLSVDQVRIAVRKTLRDCLVNRAKDADDVLLSNEEIKRFAVDIESEMFKNFGDTGTPYKQQFKGLVVNLKDAKNKGFFRRILNGTLTARKIAVMSGQEMSSRENSFWASSDDEDGSKVERQGEKAKLFVKTTAEADSTCDVFGLLIGDSTSRHKSHLFDLNCKICTGKYKSDNNEPTVKGENPINKEHAREDGLTVDVFERSNATLKVSPVSCFTPPRELAIPTNVSKKFQTNVQSAEINECTSKSSTAVIATSKRIARLSPVVSRKRLEEDTIWRGVVDMPGYFRFSIALVGVSGSVLSLKLDLPNRLKIVGRISSDVVFDYVKSIKSAPSKDIAVVRIGEPPDEAGQTQYKGLFNNMLQKGRFCVVETSKMTKIKDLYLLPLSSDQSPHPSLLPFEGQGLPVPRNDLILGIVVRRRDRIETEKVDPPPVPQVPDSLKSKLFKRQPNCDSSIGVGILSEQPTDGGIKIIKYSSSDNEEEINTTICSSNAVINHAISNTISAAQGYFPSEITAEHFEAAKRFKSSEESVGHAVEQPGPSSSKEEWMKWWCDVLSFWQSTGVSPPGTWAAPPSRTQISNENCDRLSSTLARDTAPPALNNWIIRQTAQSVGTIPLEDGEIFDEEIYNKSKADDSSAHVQTVSDNWRKLSANRSSTEAFNQCQTSSCPRMDNK